MINVLLPAMGSSVFFKDSFFPKPLIEICGKTMIELVIENFGVLENKRFIFVFHEEDCKKYHLDSSVSILAPGSSVIQLHNQTLGALCTCLMAVDLVDNENPLLIANSDQIVDIDYGDMIRKFDVENAEAGVVTFTSIHPRWSYARIIGNEVVEVAEKRPLSKNAIAGVYYYEHGYDFVEAAKRTLLKRNCLDGRYYISATMNEMILSGKKVGYYEINNNQYRSFYSPTKIKEYEENQK